MSAVAAHRGEVRGHWSGWMRPSVGKVGAEHSNSRASSPGVRPARISSTIWRRYSGAICLMILVILVMKDTRASDHFLSEEEVEGLMELLDKTSFDAAGFDRGHGRLVLWEESDPVRYWFAADELDEEASMWTKKIFKQVHQMIGRNASIRILRTSILTEADIAISCLSKDVLLNDGFFPQYFAEIGFSKEKIATIRNEIEGVYATPGYTWRWVGFDKNFPQKKTLGKFIEILHPNEEECKRALPSIFAASLGYGEFFPVESRWKSAHTNIDGFEVADHVILHFLYNSEAKSGMTREATMNIFRKWLSSNYFKKYSEYPAH